MQNKFQWEFFNGSHRLSSLVSVWQNQPSFMSYCTISRSSPINCTVYLSLIWDISATIDNTSGRRFCAFFECVLHHRQGNEKTWDSRPSWVDVTTAAGPIFLNSNSVAKQSGGVLELFSRVRQGTENRGFNRIQEKFRRSISNNK